MHWLLVQRGFDCGWPVGDSGTWDLVSDWRGKVNRLQIKSSSRPDRKTRSSHYIKVAKSARPPKGYTAKDFDFLVTVLPWGCYIIPSKLVAKGKPITLTFFQNGHHGWGKECAFEKHREAWHLLQ